MAYPSDLSAEVVLLFAEERRVSEDCSVEIASQQDFDGASSSDVFGLQVWELGPSGERLVRYPVSELVDTGSLCLEVCWLLLAFAFSTFVTSFKFTLSDVPSRFKGKRWGVGHGGSHRMGRIV